MTESKRCTHCKRVKPIEEYDYMKLGSRGRLRRKLTCRECLTIKKERRPPPVVDTRDMKIELENVFHLWRNCP